jgi:hypothetical protein
MLIHKMDITGISNYPICPGLLMSVSLPIISADITVDRKEFTVPMPLGKN